MEMCIIKKVAKFDTAHIRIRGSLVRNRGYRYIINNNDNGYMLFCINGPWINEMLRDRGIDPKKFRALNWYDLMIVQDDKRISRLLRTLRPENFWEMCDAIALAFSEYELDELGHVYEQRWFSRYPIFTKEDVYEILVDEGVDRSDAIKITEILGNGKTSGLSVSFRDFLELCDIPEELESVILKCRKLTHRDTAVELLLDSAKRAISMKSRRYLADKREFD